jgi:hypothetical protein
MAPGLAMCAVTLPSSHHVERRVALDEERRTILRPVDWRATAVHRHECSSRDDAILVSLQIVFIDAALRGSCRHVRQS